MTRHGAAGRHFCVSEPVADALADSVPVVALESALVAHGLPDPLDVETAAGMMDAIRREGAVPALVAVLDGRVRIGLDPSEIERVARDDRIVKASARDIPVLIAAGASGATTVAGTMFCARLAGIEVFATGGIGGVHRGASSTFDVSADLYELARTPVAVVCSGVKSVLDVPATLEALESLGVPVVALATDRLPAFHVRDAGLPAPHSVPDAAAAARVAASVLSFARTGVVIANPVPAADAMDRAVVERLVEEAGRLAHAANVTGKAVTPFLLEALAESSRGATLRTNRALLLDNARAAAELARHLATARPRHAGDGPESRARPPYAGDAPGVRRLPD